MWKWRSVEKKSRFVNEMWKGRSVKKKSQIANYFIQTLFMVYKDRRGNRPTETLLLTYARMLNPNSTQLIDDLLNYRNKMLRIENDLPYSEITFPTEWQFGNV